MQLTLRQTRHLLKTNVFNLTFLFRYLIFHDVSLVSLVSYPRIIICTLLFSSFFTFHTVFVLNIHIHEQFDGKVVNY